MKKKLSARERYAALSAEHLQSVAERLERIFRTPLAEGEKTYPFTSPSGMEWQLRKLNPLVFRDVGLIPNELVAKMAVLQRNGSGNAAVFEQFTNKDLARSIELNSAVVRYVCVNPRIVEVPESDDEIGFDDVITADYEAILNWATSGGGEAERLGNFPRQ